MIPPIATITKCLEDWAGHSYPRSENDAHIQSGLAWLFHAQDVFPDDGISRGYTLRSGYGASQVGWQASSPSSSAYVASTFLKAEEQLENPKLLERTRRILGWLSQVQMEVGALPSGTVDKTPIPVVFNTGSGLAAWVRGYKKTGEKRFLQSAERAVNFLIENQDDDGAWRLFSSKNEAWARTHDVRTAWALLLFAELSKDRKCQEAAEKNLHYTMKKQLDNGWFQENCLRPKYHHIPLLHTISYAIRGLIESGLLLDNRHAIDRGVIAARALVRCQAPDGGLKGRYDAYWRPAVKWCCLSGIGQMALCWFRCYEITRDNTFLSAGLHANGYLKSRQNLNTSLPHVRGGLTGSYPVYAPYAPFQYVNWTVTFFIDSLLKDSQLS